MNYLSVCSGIEAATVAWHPLGWVPVAFAEVDNFANAVLRHHYPHVPNLGDMTKFHEWKLPTFSILVGGTPCQAFSIAGLRAGLADPRGNLTLTFLALAGKHRPRWVVWENVPGVLSDRTNAFGQFLSGLAELGYGWAYRVLDAQYFGVPQRRRRVFVIGCLGDSQGAAEVLFERESLRGDSPPRRAPRERVAPTISSRTQGGGGLGTDAELDGALIPDVADCLQERDWRGPDTQTKNGHLIPDVSPTLRAGGNKTGGDRPPGTDVDTCDSLLPIAFGSKDSGEDALRDISPTLRAGGPRHSHANSGVPPAVAFHENQRGEVTTSETTQALNKGGGKPGQGYPAIAIQERAISENPANGPDGVGVRADDTAYTLEARQTPQAVAFKPSHYTRGKDGAPSEVYPPLSKEADRGDQEAVIHTRMAVRRLTPVECERLQGFPDGYTAIPSGKKSAENCPDGPRYKVLGNSMAVPVMAWIGRRIAAVNEERFSV